MRGFEARFHIKNFLIKRNVYDKLDLVIVFKKVYYGVKLVVFIVFNKIKERRIFAHHSSHFMSHLLSISYKQIKIPLISKFFWWKFSKTKVVTGKVLRKKVLLKISENSQENTYVRVSFLINFGKRLRASILKNICERLVLTKVQINHILLWWLLLKY